MQVVVSGKHLDITPALQEHATTKVRKACDHLKQLPTRCQVILSKEGLENKAEFILHYQGHDFVAHANSQEDMYKTIDATAIKIRRQLDDFRNKQNKK